MINIANNNN